MKYNRTRVIQISLFIITCITTTIAGAEWRYGKSFFAEDPLTFSQLGGGLYFSIAFLGILTFHEFGHYFTAQYHKVKVSLPYYIPLWLVIGPSIGTMGAFIRIKEKVESRKLYFDIGVAGPIAGFVVAVFVIIYGFLNLPGLDYLFQIHPEYAQFGADYADHVFDDESVFMIRFGPNLFFWLCENFLPFDPGQLPHANELIHYPFFLAGYLALFFTSLNLFPIGQLDGGHVLYGLLGARIHQKVAPVVFLGFLTYAGTGVITPAFFDMSSTMGLVEDVFWAVLYLYFLYFCLYSIHPNQRLRMWLAAGVFLTQFLIIVAFPEFEGYPGWLLFLFLIGRFLGVYHPPVIDNRPLDLKRKIIGWFAVVIFILSFSPKPFIITEPKITNDTTEQTAKAP